MPKRSSYSEGTPCWADLQTSDLDGAKAFYGALFGWSFEDQPIPGGVYSMALLDGETVAAAAPQNPDTAAAGMPPMWNTYIAVDDVDAVTARAAASGGQAMMEPFDVMEAGRMAWVGDPTGGSVGLWQAGAHIGATLVNEPGALTWNELISDNLAAALAFYTALLGIRAEEQDMGGQPYTMLYVGDDVVGGATAPPTPGVPNHWHVWFAVADVDQTAATAASAGGSVIVGPMDMPVGRIAALVDPQGAAFNVIALSQSS
jgi:hypothetical protein